MFDHDIRVKQKLSYLTVDLPLTAAFLTLKNIVQLIYRVNQKLSYLTVDLPPTVAFLTLKNVVQSALPL